MKSISIIVAFLMTINLNGQVEILEGKMAGVEIKKYTMEDTIPKVIYLKKNRLSEGVKFYLNGQMINGAALATINPNYIEELTVEKKGDSEKDDAIYVTLTKDYQPKFISLNDLKNKYLDTLEGQTLFFMNDQTIHDDYNNYMVDEKNIMTIKLEEINNSGEKIDITLIRLYSRTEENLKKANTIILRGDNLE